MFSCGHIRPTGKDPIDLGSDNWTTKILYHGDVPYHILHSGCWGSWKQIYHQVDSGDNNPMCHIALRVVDTIVNDSSRKETIWIKIWNNFVFIFSSNFSMYSLITDISSHNGSVSASTDAVEETNEETENGAGESKSQPESKSQKLTAFHNMNEDVFDLHGSYFNSPCVRVRSVDAELIPKKLVGPAVVITNKRFYTVAFLVRDPMTKDFFWLLIDGVPWYNGKKWGITSLLEIGKQNLAFHNRYDEKGGNALGNVIRRTADRHCKKGKYEDEAGREVNPSGLPNTTRICLCIQECSVMWTIKGVEKTSVRISIESGPITSINGLMEKSKVPIRRPTPNRRKKKPGKKR